MMDTSGDSVYTYDGLGFLTEDTYLGDIRNPLTLNRYSYCIGNPLFYSDPSGHWGVDLAALESEMMNTLNERDRRVSEVTDYIYDKTGEILGTHNDSEVDQVVSGFVAGFAGSFYETFDLITHPEIILANVFEAVTHPVETVIGVIKNKYTKGLDVFFQYLVEENYRMVGQEAGRMAGEKVQELIAAAVVATVLQMCGDEGPSIEGGSSSGYYQDANGRWHRPNGQFASNSEVGIDSSAKVSTGSHGNSLSDPRTNYGYVLVDKNTNEILKFGETIHPTTRYLQNYLDANNANMMILERGNKLDIHLWQHDMNEYYFYKYNEYPPLNSGGW